MAAAGPRVLTGEIVRRRSMGTRLAFATIRHAVAAGSEGGEGETAVPPTAVTIFPVHIART